MSSANDQKNSTDTKKPNPTLGLFSLLKAYKAATFGLLIFSLGANLAGLVIPQIISNAIDTYQKGTFDFNFTLTIFGTAAIAIFIFTFIQSIFQTYVSESVARNIRNSVAEKVSRLSYLKVQELTPAALLTNLTSDIDNIKTFISQGIVLLFSSIVLIIGSAIFLFTINWKLALAVLLILPMILILFFVVFRNIGKLFERSQAVIDSLNKIISESILASSLVRVLNSQAYELQKFEVTNNEAKSVGLSILKLFAIIIPFITFIANLTTVVILLLGGYFVINNEMTLGQFTAFLNYVSILIFPLIVLGFLSNLIARAATSYGRILTVLDSEDDKPSGQIKEEIKGHIEFKNINLDLASRGVLKNINFDIQPGSRTAILGPTAAGKTQIFYLLAKLLQPDSGEILVDGKKITEFDSECYYEQLGLVFQDSVIFNTTILENISFRNTTNITDANNQSLQSDSSTSTDSDTNKEISSKLSHEVSSESVQKAIETAELADFISSLPKGLNTIVSERGTSLSGGQKQRLTLARALALNPKILLLDDFTARIDNATEKRIFENISKNYPNITQISITQKIASIQDFDKIILLMEGEILAQGTHEELMNSSFEYKQIYDSQQSTEESS